MPLTIQVRHTDDGIRFCPCFVCDQCGKTIKDARRAIVDYDSSFEYGSFASDLRFYHAGKCAMQGKNRLSIQLDHCISMLTHNTGFKVREYNDEFLMSNG